MTVLVATVALVAVAGPAIAAWTAGGIGSGSARARALAAPTGGTATSPTTTTLALSWSAPAGSSGMPVSYTVTRNGGAAAANCTNISATSCTDTFASSANAQTFTYVITANVGDWTASSTSFQGTSTAAPAAQAAPTNFRVTSCTTTKVSGTVTATVTLAWTPASGATSQTLRQGTSNPPTGTPQTFNNNTTATHVFTTTATPNYYSIVATSSAGSSTAVVIGPLTTSTSGPNGTCTPPS